MGHLLNKPTSLSILTYGAPVARGGSLANADPRQQGEEIAASTHRIEAWKHGRIWAFPMAEPVREARTTMSDYDSLEVRVRQLEELLSHQDHRYEQLNDVLVALRANHDQLKDALARRIGQLESRLEDRASSLDPDEKPPHY